MKDERVWANFPFRHMDQFLSHYFQQKELCPGIMGCFVVPVWRRQPWWPLVDGLQVLAHYPAGTELFTAPMPDGSRRSLGPTRWAVEVRYDPADQPGDATFTSVPVVDPVVAECAVKADAAGSCKPAKAAFWRLSVAETTGMESRPPDCEGCAEVHASAASQALPRLIHVKGKAASKTATMFLDSGAQLNLVSRDFVRQHALKQEPARFSVNFPDGRGASLDGLVRDVPIKMGTYVVHLDLHVFDLRGNFDVLLGKGWHDLADPKIHWRLNVVQVLQEGKFHRFGTSQKPFTADGEVEAAPQVSGMTVKAFRKQVRSGECFIAYIKACQPETSHEVNAVATDGGSTPSDPCREPTGNPQYAEVLQAYAKVFAGLPPGLPPERAVQHTIDLLPGSRPKAKPPYRLSKLEEEECVRQLKNYLEMGHIQPSRSPYGAPVLFSRKKNGGLRFCVDYRALNDQTIKDRFPLPRIDDMLDRLHGAQVFSKLDLAQGYHQVRVAEEDVHKTAFTTASGHFEFKVMPFGLCNGPATFQRLMNSALNPLIGRCCMVYLDDIIIYSRDVESHKRDLALVLEKLQETNLYTQLSKCEFGLKELEFLGHIVSADGIKMDPSKISAMTGWPVPKNVKEVRGFLGLVNYYRRFIKDFAKMALPLTDLTKEDRSFEWSAPAQKAFEQLKHAMVSGPVLQTPDFSKPFRVFTDACQFAAGATLEQKHGSEWLPVAYFSKKFIPAQRNYNTKDREALGIVLALQEWRCYLQGSHFVVNNDHHTLQRIQQQATVSGRTARWAEFLQEFDCTIQYVKGCANAAADAFSRRPDLFAIGATQVGLQADFVDKLKAAYTTDTPLKELLEKKTVQQKDGFYWHRFGKLYIPLALRRLLILEAHRSAYSGHFGVIKVYAKLQESLWWPRMRQTIEDVLRTCHECQVVQPRNSVKYGLAHPLEIPTRRWDHVTLDLITGLPPSKTGRDACTVFVDRLTKMVHYAPCFKTCNAQDMAALFIDTVIKHHGWPSVVISDRDPRFDSEFWRAVLDGSGTQLRMSTPYHPETDGQTERANRTLLAMLRKFAVSSGRMWEEQLPWLEFAYNDSESCATGYSPFFLNTGSHPNIPLRGLVQSDTPTIPGDSPAGRAFQRRLNEALQLARSNLSLSAARQKHLTDRRRKPSPIKTGDEVLLDSDVFHFPELDAHKLKEKWYGPLRVISANAETVQLRTPLDKNFHCRVHVAGCKLYHRAEALPVMPDSQIDKQNWEIRKIVGHRWVDHPRRKQFRCRFMHPPHDTPDKDEFFYLEQLKAGKLIRAYNLALKQGALFKNGVLARPAGQANAKFISRRSRKRPSADPMGAGH